MNSTIKTLVICASLVITGCATTASEQALLIRDADSKAVESCKYLGDVHGSSGVGGMSASIGITNSKNEALEKAVKLKATHIYWSSVTGGMSPSAYGKAYDCSHETNHNSQG